MLENMCKSPSRIGEVHLMFVQLLNIPVKNMHIQEYLPLLICSIKAEYSRINLLYAF